MSKMTKLTIFSLSLVFVSMLASNAADAVGNSNTKPNHKPNELINLYDAYRNNPTITGKGVVVGIIDGVFNPLNPILTGKDVGLINSVLDPNEIFRFTIDKGRTQHGSQVASIITGNRESLKGVAYDTKYFGLAYLNPSPAYRFEHLKSDTETMIKAGARIINHSYASDVGFPLINRKWGNGFESINGDYSSADNISVDDFQKLLKTEQSMMHAQILADLAKQYDVLNIVGSGNDGIISNRANSTLPTYDENYRELIVVGGFNPEKVTKNNDGSLKFHSFTEEERKHFIEQYKDANITTDKHKKTISEKMAFILTEKQGIFAHSNLFRGGSSLYALLAPSQHLITANGRYGYADTSNNNQIDQELVERNSAGTSFATPYVTGVAALIQQKYPFLKAKQVADTLLTTANKNVELPKMIIMKNVTPNLGHTFWTVIYTKENDYKAAKDGDKIKLDVLKKDLKEMGYKRDDDEGVVEVITKEVLKNDLDVAKQDTTYPVSVVYMEKEEIIGQGIVDANKALGGIATLDANRMNKEDVANFYDVADKKLEKQAFYTIDTGYKTDNSNVTYTFTNTIGQKEYNDKYHLKNALNSPSEVIKDIQKIGLIKKGSGMLVLEGDTTYKGATRVQEGVLEIKAWLKESNAYAEDKGVLKLTGKDNKAQNTQITQTQAAQPQTSQAANDVLVKNVVAINGGSVILHNNVKVQNLYAKDGGVIHALQGSAESAEISNQGLLLVQSTLADSTSAYLTANQANSTQNLNTLLTANNPVKITNVTLKDSGMLGGNGKLEGEVNNNSGIVYAGFTPDTTSLKDSKEQQTLDIQGKYTQDNQGKLVIGFIKGKDGNTMHTDMKATNYDIKGGTLELLPVYNKDGERIKSGDSLKFNLAFLNTNANNANFSNIEVTDTRTLSIKFDQTTQTLTAELKTDALKTTMSSEISHALSSIYKDTQGNTVYDEFFKRLDFVDWQTFSNTLDSIAENASLDTIADELNAQQNHNFTSLGFILTPMDNTFRASKNSPIRLASAGYMQNVLANAFRTPKNQQMTLDTSYSKMNHKNYTASTLSTRLQYKARVQNNIILGMFGDYAKNTASHTYTERGGNTYSLGASIIYNLGSFSLLGSTSIGLRNNTATRTIIGAGNASAKYNTTSYFAQLGLSKDIALTKNFTLKPMVLTNASGVRQSGYKESGEIFAIKREAATYNAMGASLGAHIIYTLPIGLNELDLSVFGFYTIRFLDSIQSRASFKDFVNSQHFVQTASLNTSSVYAGANVRWQYRDYFTHVSASIENTKSYTIVNGMLSLGFYF